MPEDHIPAAEPQTESESTGQVASDKAASPDTGLNTASNTDNTPAPQPSSHRLRNAVAILLVIILLATGAMFLFMQEKAAAPEASPESIQNDSAEPSADN
jgi:cytochrome bd-type quinol oxidase subunit 1